ncbi:hypothetical protein VTI74DRAFT_1885 [Chaetomium olivicolor]
MARHFSAGVGGVLEQLSQPANNEASTGYLLSSSHFLLPMCKVWNLRNNTTVTSYQLLCSWWSSNSQPILGDQRNLWFLVLFASVKLFRTHIGRLPPQHTETQATYLHPGSVTIQIENYKSRKVVERHVDPLDTKKTVAKAVGDIVDLDMAARGSGDAATVRYVRAIYCEILSLVGRNEPKSIKGLLNLGLSCINRR